MTIDAWIVALVGAPVCVVILYGFVALENRATGETRQLRVFTPPGSNLRAVLWALGAVTAVVIDLALDPPIGVSAFLGLSAIWMAARAAIHVTRLITQRQHSTT